MKTVYKSMLLIILSLICAKTYADDFEVDGIYYTTDREDNSIAIVTSGKYDYEGEIVIPSTVIYNGKQLRVTTIGYGAFSMCEELSKVTLPEGLLKIEEMAFYASGLERVTIPGTVINISSNSFQSCDNLKAINVVESNNYYSEVDGVIFDKGKSTLICYPSGKGVNYTVPEGTKSIGKKAFAGSKVMNVILNDDLDFIDDAAFGNTEMKCLIIPASVKRFGNYIFELTTPEYIISRIINPQDISVTAFEYTEYFSQDEIYDNTVLYVPQGTESKYKSLNGWKNFSSIKECDRLEVDGFEYEVSHGTPLATLFKKSTEIKYNETIEIPETIIYEEQTIPVIGVAEDAFKSTRLNSVTLGKNIQVIGNNAFNNCQNLKSVTVKNETPVSINENVFEGVYANATLIVPQKKKAVYSATAPWNMFTKIKEVDGEIIVEDLLYELDFSKNTATVLKKNTYVSYSDEIQIPETIPYQEQQYSVIGVAEDAFKSTGLKSITLGTNILMIGDNAFNNCKNLKTVTVKNETPVSINDNVFEGVYGNATLIVPRGKRTIYSTTAPWSKFHPNIKEIDSEITDDGIVYEVDYLTKRATVVGCNKYDIPNDVIIPENILYDDEFIPVVSIEDSVFKDVTELRSIELPKSIQIIGEKAFSNCLQLTTVVSDILAPIAINDNVFEGVYSRASLIVPIEKCTEYSQANGWKNFKVIEEVQSVYDFVVDNLTLHAEMKLNRATVTAYDGNEDTLIIPESIVKYGTTLNVRQIANAAFVNCSLKTISFPSTLTEISKGAFQNCNSLCALTWNSTTPFPSETLQDIGNPNLLLYLNSNSAIPSGESNSIVNGVAEIISLKDADNGNFYCPQRFTAKQIRYIHNYSMETVIGKSQGWESIVLPFDVQQIRSKIGVIVPYAAVANEDSRFFWLREMTDDGFTDASEIKANKPYIISMPNNKWYDEVYNITGDVEFYSENVDVLESSDIGYMSNGRRKFVPTYHKVEPTTNSYALNVYDSGGEYAPGSVFIRNLRTIHPFECYIEDKTSQARAISIGEYTTGVDDFSFNSQDAVYVIGNTLVVESNSPKNIAIYNIYGILVKNFKVKKGRNELNGLPSGLYIIKGKKYVIM